LSEGKSKILELLRKYGELNQIDIVRFSGLSKSRVSELLSELEREGLIERRKALGRNLVVRLSSKFVKIGIIKAAEYPFIMPFVKNLRDKGYIVNIIIYDNGLELTKDLAMGKLDIGLSPVVTQLFFQRVFNTFEIVAGGAKGGGALIGSPDCKSIGSTVMSSMEAWTLSYYPDAELVEFNGPEEMLNSIKSGKVKTIAIWEPYVTYLSNNGFKVIHRFEPLHCCTLAINKRLNIDEIKRIYEISFTNFLEEKDRWVQAYSNLVGVDYPILSEAIKHYIFDSYLDLNEIKKSIRKNKIYI